MAVLSLDDIWRDRNPDELQFTFLGKYQNDIVIRSRLDRWLTSRFLSPFIKEITFEDLGSLNLDHKMIKLTLCDPAHIPPGPGYWKLNTSTLKDPLYIAGMSQILGNIISTKDSFINPMDWWDHLKVSCKKFSIDFCKIQANFKTQSERLLRAELKRVESQLNSSPHSSRLRQRLLETKSEIEKLETEKLEGLTLGIRTKYLVAQETPSKAVKMISNFSIKEKVITSLKHPVKGTTSDTVLMLETSTLFYKNLYRSPPNPQEADSAQTAILQFWPKPTALSPTPSNLDNPITVEEAQAALHTIPDNKTPGLDGLPIEFYKTFWNLLGPHIAQLLNDILDHGLPISQQTAVVSLVYKKGDPTDIANYRPISVLCHDYKILAKILVLRLHTVTEALIGREQTGVKGRFIGENVRQLLDTLEYLNITKKSGIILLLDQAKAFDVVSWSFMHKILAHVGLPPKIRDWISRLYEKPASVYKINNHLSQPIDLLCGVRQGCPLSPFLFCLTIEAFAKALKADSQIQGILIPGRPPTKNLSALYLDDTILFLNGSQDLQRVKPLCRLYCQASNASFNWAKSDGILVNLKRPPLDPQFNINWLNPGDQYKILGVKLCNSFPLDMDVPWKDIVQNFANTLKRGAWNFSLKGRVTFVQTYAMSQLYYMTNAIPPSPAFANNLQNMIWKYIWSGSRRGKVSREVMLQPASRGGLGVPSVHNSLLSIQIKWIQRLLNTHPFYESPWAALASFFLQNQFSEYGLGMFSLLFRPSISSNNYIPEFWRTAINGWWLLLDPCDPTLLSKEEILSFPLFLNPVIKIDGKPLQGKPWLDWASKGISRVRDLWFDGTWATPQQLLEQYGINNPALLNSLIATLPMEWHGKLLTPWTLAEGLWATDLTVSFEVFKPTLTRGSHVFAISHFGPSPTPITLLTDGPLQEISKREDLRPLRIQNTKWAFMDLQPTLPTRTSLRGKPSLSAPLKLIRNELNPPFNPPAIDKWNIICQNLDWKKILSKLWKPVVPRKWNQTFYLLLLRGLDHGERAYRLDLDFPPNYYCHCCPARLETLQHIFHECSIAQNLLAWLRRTWKNGTGLAPPNTLHFMLSGYAPLPRHPNRSLLQMILEMSHRTLVHTLWRIRCEHHHQSLPSIHQIRSSFSQGLSQVISQWMKSNQPLLRQAAELAIKLHLLPIFRPLA